MPSRYYFLSSLPMLNFSDSAPMDWDSFLYQAEGNVSAQDYRLLCAMPEEKDCGNAFLKKWQAFSKGLQSAVNVQRRERLGRPADDSVLFWDYDVEQYAKAAAGARNPLEAETLLLQCRFGWLDEARGFDSYSQTALLAYALQLRILIRKDLFNREAGNSEYRKLFGILQKEMKMK